MPVSTTMTVRLSTELKDKLERISKETRRSKSFLAADAIEAFVTRELHLIEMIEEGRADVAAGRTVPHDEVMADIDAIIDQAIATKAVKSA